MLFNPAFKKALSIVKPTENSILLPKLLLVCKNLEEKYRFKIL